MLRRLATGAVALVACSGLLLTSMLVGLFASNAGTPSPAAHSTGRDAEWLGHAWVDGRKGQSDVDVLAAQLRNSGIQDLFVHAGPFNDDGTLDPGLRPRARWLTNALHRDLPGVRVQAWLGAHPGDIRLDWADTRARVVTAAGQILDDGFDGVHYDFEPVADGDPDLLTMLEETRQLTRSRGRVLSVSAIHAEPWSGLAAVVTMLPASLALWSGAYLHEVAVRVDQVALMSYDTTLSTVETYAGYVRQTTEIALEAVPPDVALLIGVPAYHEESFYHRAAAETLAPALRGVRLALGDQPADRPFGVALYVDFTITAEDWATFHRDWRAPPR